jgi:hypothetical protein
MRYDGGVSRAPVTSAQTLPRYGGPYRMLAIHSAAASVSGKYPRS